MNRQSYIDYIKLMLTGTVLELEIDDETVGRIVDQACVELQRYITTSELVTAPFSQCIKVGDIVKGYEKKPNGEYLLDENGNTIPVKVGEVSSVVSVYRTKGLTSVSGADNTEYTTVSDPMQMAQWQLLGGMGNINYFQDAVYNYTAYTTLQQIRNTLSTDLAFRYDEVSDNLYINTSEGTPSTITIEYIPVIKTADDVKGYFWQDQLRKLSLALAKVVIGRIRTKYTQSNALWQNDGQNIIQEGQQELQAIREELFNNSQYFYPID